MSCLVPDGKLLPSDPAREAIDEGSTRLDETVIRYRIAAGFLCFAAWRTLDLAGDIGLLKSTVGGPFHSIAEDTFIQILFTVILVFPALYATDWLLKSRTQTIVMSLAALVVVLCLVSGS